MKIPCKNINYNESYSKKCVGGGVVFTVPSPKMKNRVNLFKKKVSDSDFPSVPKKLSSDVYSVKAANLNFYSSHYNNLNYFLTKFEDNMTSTFPTRFGVLSGM